MDKTINSECTKNKKQLLQSCKPYFDLLLKLISNAKQRIHIQTYIFNDDETGKSIVKALKIIAQKKVKIQHLVDGYASQNLSRIFIENLKKANIEFRFFKPFFLK